MGICDNSGVVELQGIKSKTVFATAMFRGKSWVPSEAHWTN